MFKSKLQSYSAFMMLVFCLGVDIQMVAESAELIKNPMKPPEFALKKYRLAKPKESGGALLSKTPVKKSATKTMNLSSVLIGSQRKVVIINDQTLVVGDRIGNYKLVAVFKDRVQLLSSSGKRTVLKLENEVTAVRKNAVEGKL